MPDCSQDLIDREHAWMDAVQRKDVSELEQILASEYVYTASGQGWWTRQRWLDTVAIYDIHRFSFVDVDVRAYGDVGVVLSRYHQEALVNGEHRSGEFLLTDVWVKRDGRWQVVARSSILVQPAASSGTHMDAKAIVLRFIEDGLNRGDLSVIDELVAEDVVVHPPPPGQVPGRDGVREFAAAQREAAPDWHITVADAIAEGDMVAVRATGRGTPLRPYFGILATTWPIEVSWIAIYRVSGGQIVERWTEADWLGLMRRAVTHPTD